MLGNNEKIENVDHGVLFSKMVKELPWSALRIYIQSNASLLKMCTFGGHRLEPQKRDRLEKIVCRETKKLDYSESACNGVFASWYPVHEELHKSLEDYFHSDEYKTYRTEHKLTDEDYVLSKEKFDSFFKGSDLLFWKLLLCFSPLRFSAEQGKQILDSQAGSAELIEKLEKTKQQLEELKKKNTQLQNESDRLRSTEQAVNNEIQGLKKLNRALKADVVAEQNKFISSQAELKCINQRLENSNSEVQDKVASVKGDAERNLKRVQGELDRLNKDLTAWQSKYEEQRLQNRGLEEKAVEAERVVRDANREITKTKEIAKEELDKMAVDLKASRNYADLFLSRIDWGKIGSSMKLNPSMRRNFNSLIKNLNYEEDMSLTFEKNLVDFWQDLTKIEATLITEVAKSNTLEAMDGNMDKFWEKMGEGFDIAKTALEAKIVLIGILQGIFSYDFKNEDLAEPVIPVIKTK